MADYKVTDTELTSIANAIRTKGGTQAQLEFPTGFVSAVQAIPTGGGSPFVTPDYQGLSYAYVTQYGQFYQGDGGKEFFINCFPVIAGVTYALFVGSVTSDRNRCAFYSGKGINDFMPYIDNGASSAALIYEPTNVISSGEPAADVRHIFTPSSDGEIVLITSRSSVQAIAYCVELP